MKQSLIIKDENLNEKYCISGQTGIYKENGYIIDKDYPILKEENNSERFILIDLWQLGVFGSENCPYKYNQEKDINEITEQDINKFTDDVINYIKKDLHSSIKKHIIDEIKANENENIIFKEMIK